MICHYVNGQDQEVFAGNLRDLQAASAWAQCLFHLIYGKDLGDRMYRQVPARRVLSVWAWTVQRGDA